MGRREDPELDEFLFAYEDDPRLPLYVLRSRYDERTVSWEVLYDETPTSQLPIAEFDTWAEAQAWAGRQARISMQHGAIPIRHILESVDGHLVSVAQVTPIGWLDVV